ncbi:MAG: protein kinase domain-containing protein [Candidatus Binataceae bacterium]
MRAIPQSFCRGKYQVLGLLGQGGSKVVYRARDTELDRDVAFAILKADGLDETTRARLKLEKKTMGQLGEHPNIVNIYDAGEDEGRPYIVSQYMAGGSVADLLKKQKSVPFRVALQIADDVCQALEFAHSRNFIHRDLKPDNVWLMEKGTAKLGDFGLALGADTIRLTEAGFVPGTVIYLSPERAKGAPAEPRSDLYSLGVMLYEMVAGRPPFLGEDPQAIMAQHLAAAVEPPSKYAPKLPKPLEQLILKLLAKDPERRPATASLVSKELRCIADNLKNDRPAKPNADASAEIQRTTMIREPPAPSRDNGADLIAVFFSDIENSTPMFERLGDVRAKQLITEIHDAIFRKRLAEHDGFERKTTGDGFMIEFAKPGNALKCAIDVQRDFDDYCETHSEEPIRVRIGLNYGEVLRTRDDIYGSVVIDAHRVMEHGKGGEILVSSSIKDMLRGGRDFSFDEGRQVELKGVEGQHRIFQLGWRQRSLLCLTCRRSIPNYTLDCPNCRKRSPSSGSMLIASTARTIASCSNSVVREVAAQYRAAELKVSADNAIVFAFDSAAEAIGFATAAQQKFGETSDIQIGADVPEPYAATDGKRPAAGEADAAPAIALMNKAQRGEIMVSERARSLPSETPLVFDETTPVTIELGAGSLKGFRLGWKEKEQPCPACSAKIPVYTTQCLSCAARTTSITERSRKSGGIRHLPTAVIETVRESGWKSRSMVFAAALGLGVWILLPPNPGSGSSMKNTTAFQLEEPRAITLDDDHVYLVARDTTGTDSYNVFAWANVDALQKNKPPYALGNPGGCGQPLNDLCMPSDLATDKDHRIYVADRKKNMVLVYDSPFEGSVDEPRWIRGDCNSPGTFCEPSGLAVDSAERLYVADPRRDRILEFDNFRVNNAAANLVYGDLSRPEAVAVDSDDRLFVADTGHNRIVVYAKPGKTEPDQVLGQPDLQGPVRLLFGLSADKKTTTDLYVIAGPDNSRILQVLRKKPSGDFESPVAVPSAPAGVVDAAFDGSGQQLLLSDNSKIDYVDDPTMER